MDVPGDLAYTAEHQWARVEADGVRVGVTDFAQEALGEVVFVALPAPGTAVVAGDVLGEVESTKSVSELYAPIAGTVLEANQDLLEDPGRCNRDPYGEGWICRLRPAVEGPLEGLLTSDEYRNLTAS